MGHAVNISPKSRLASKKNPRSRRAKQFNAVKARIVYDPAQRAHVTEVTVGGKKVRGEPLKMTKQIFVQVQDGSAWKTIALLKDTPELRKLAKRFARTYKRKHPAAVVKVTAG